MVDVFRKGRSVLWVMAFVAGVILSPDSPARAASGGWELGLLGGWSFANYDESFNKYDLYGTYGLPWGWQWGEALQVDTNLVATATLLDAGDETALAGSLGFELVFGSVSGRFPLELRIGESVTVLEKEDIGEEDFGGLLQFTTHIGLNYRLMEHLSAVAQVQHTSNAGIYEKNPGINTIMVGVVYAF